MKKLFCCVFAAIAAMSCFTSCDEDEKKAMALSGEWQGDFYSCYYYYYKQEKTPRIAYADRTYMKFVTDHMFGSTRGEGFEIDEYDSGPIAYTMYEFDWRISDGVIYLEYFDAPDMNVAIHNYRLSSGHFKGYFGENNNSFDLYNLDGCRWDEYHGPYATREVSYTYSFGTADRYDTRSAEVSETSEVADYNIVSFGRAKKPVVEE